MTSLGCKMLCVIRHCLSRIVSFRDFLAATLFDRGDRHEIGRQSVNKVDQNIFNQQPVASMRAAGRRRKLSRGRGTSGSNST